jgi:hypothetical protein
MFFVKYYSISSPSFSLIGSLPTGLEAFKPPGGTPGARVEGFNGIGGAEGLGAPMSVLTVSKLSRSKTPPGGVVGFRDVGTTLGAPDEGRGDGGGGTGAVIGLGIPIVGAKGVRGALGRTTGPPMVGAGGRTGMLAAGGILGGRGAGATPGMEGVKDGGGAGLLPKRDSKVSGLMGVRGFGGMGGAGATGAPGAFGGSASAFLSRRASSKPGTGIGPLGEGDFIPKGGAPSGGMAGLEGTGGAPIGAAGGAPEGMETVPGVPF